MPRRRGGQGGGAVAVVLLSVVVVIVYCRVVVWISIGRFISWLSFEL
jgi:hypothetical protein